MNNPKHISDVKKKEDRRKTVHYVLSGGVTISQSVCPLKFFVIKTFYFWKRKSVWEDGMTIYV